MKCRCRWENAKEFINIQVHTFHYLLHALHVLNSEQSEETIDFTNMCVLLLTHHRYCVAGKRLDTALIQCKSGKFHFLKNHWINFKKNLTMHKFNMWLYFTENRTQSGPIVFLLCRVNKTCKLLFWTTAIHTIGRCAQNKQQQQQLFAYIY